MEVYKRTSSKQDILFIVVGTLLMAISVNTIYEPMDMVTGGVSGLAIVIKYFTKIPIWLINAIINIPLFIIALKVKGKNFISKTLFATICFTIALYIIPSFNIQNEDIFLASITGGVIGGTGLGLVFLTSASTGGTDLMSSIIQHYFRHYSIAQILAVLDGGIVLLGAVIFGINKAVYAIIAVYITSKIMDNILEGLKFAKLAYIISDEYETIAKVIMKNMDRGVTGIKSVGMYSKSNKQMLFCVVSKKEIAKLKEVVSKIDNKAFLIISDVREVMGEGFIEYRQ